MRAHTHTHAHSTYISTEGECGLVREAAVKHLKGEQLKLLRQGGEGRNWYLLTATIVHEIHHCLGIKIDNSHILE